MLRSITMVIVFMLSVILISLWGRSASLAQNPTAPTLAVTSTPSIYDIFPYGLDCSHVQKGSGPNWGDLKIGQSTLNDLQKIYSSGYEITIDAIEDMTKVTLWIDDIGFSYRMCVLDGVIYVIEGVPSPPEPRIVAVTPDLSSQPVNIFDYVETYGVPDSVTYAFDPSKRVAFWFDEGIAVVVYVRQDDESYFFGFGVVDKPIFFPYQESEGYENRWPFSSTQLEWIYTSNPDIPSEQNPFDFDTALPTPEPTHMSN